MASPKRVCSEGNNALLCPRESGVCATGQEKTNRRPQCALALRGLQVEARKVGHHRGRVVADRLGRCGCDRAQPNQASHIHWRKNQIVERIILIERGHGVVRPKLEKKCRLVRQARGGVVAVDPHHLRLGGVIVVHRHRIRRNVEGRRKVLPVLVAIHTSPAGTHEGD